jgi:hypothetical protein
MDNIFKNLPLNPEIQLDVISESGYSPDDMNMYYVDSIVLHMKDDGGYALVVPKIYNGDGFTVKPLGSDELVSIPVNKLYRFVVPQGLYLDGNGGWFAYEYVMKRSHKKALIPSNMMFTCLEENSTGHHPRRNNLINDIKCIVFDVKPSEDVYNISRRLLVDKGKIYTMYKTLTVGSIDNGVVKTPFKCIKERLHA